MKIAVVGAGWYGCHIATRLLQNSHDVTVFEKGRGVFSGASSRNQNRLHLGFHYPRDYITRSQSLEGFSWFMDHYSGLLEIVPNNYYAIAAESSCMDFQTYLQIVKSQKLKYKKISDPIVELKKISGCISVDEMLLRSDLAAKYFNSILGTVVRLNTYVDLNNELVRNKICSDYDLVIDCTWMTSNISTSLDIIYEPCIYFYYKKKIKDKFAITVMDGKFFSLYPFKDDIFTLTSVEYTPVDRVKSFDQALKCVNLCDNNEYINSRRVSFEDLTCTYYPNFLNDFQYFNHTFSIKTKIKSSTDFRGTIVEKVDNLISVFSGKIDTIHVAEKKILEFIR